MAGVARRGTRCPHYLDNFQTWLSTRATSRTRTSSTAIFNGISSGLDALVRWLYDVLSSG